MRSADRRSNGKPPGPAAPDVRDAVEVPQLQPVGVQLSLEHGALTFIPLQPTEAAANSAICCGDGDRPGTPIISRVT